MLDRCVAGKWKPRLSLLRMPGKEAKDTEIEVFRSTRTAVPAASAGLPLQALFSKRDRSENCCADVLHKFQRFRKRLLVAGMQLDVVGGV